MIVLTPGFGNPDGMQQELLIEAPGDSAVAGAPAARELEFYSDGVVCRGLHFGAANDRLTTTAGTPCVVLAHGFGGTLAAGLFPYARAFAQAGLQALVFDYRHFGISDGNPRQLISIRRQLADWHAAVACARSLAGVDPERIVLWGVSFSGGHVINVAAHDPRIRTVIAQFPMLDGLAALWHIRRYAGYGQLLGLLRAGISDVVSTLVRRRPVMLPIVAAPGQLAAMSTPDAEPGYRAIVPADWQNTICARIALTIPLYRPGFLLGRLKCPVLIQFAIKDSILPSASLQRFIPQTDSRVKIAYYPVSHFDAFSDKGFEQCIADQISFIDETMKKDLR